MNLNLNLTYTEPQIEIFFGDVRRFNSVSKGRRFGATRGAAHACIEWCLEGQAILWGDTIAGNIKRYWDRYFIPALKASGIEGKLTGENVGKIGSGYIDFRSADRPENWEGFGYKKIILNEAGIILANTYLYTNAVLPMMMDHPEAQLFALGVPKGKYLKTGKIHPFYQIHSSKDAEHRSLEFSTYHNPYLSPEDIAKIEDEITAMDPKQVEQEIYGKFIDRVAGNPFAFAFDPLRHIGKATRRPTDLHYFSIDFNVEPFCAISSHIWQDKEGHHAHTFGEVSLQQSSIEGMAAWIRSQCPALHLIRITGDRNGYNRAIGKNGPTVLYDDLRRALQISKAQFEVPGNPTHVQSREDTNYVYANHPDRIIDSTCTGLIADLRGVEVDGQGKIIKGDRSKSNQRADLIDCDRYNTNTYLRKWIQQSRR